MKEKIFREYEMFQNVRIFLLDKNKDNLEILKEKTSMYSNIEVDNSGLIRAMIEFFIKNQELLKDLVPFVGETMGFVIEKKITEMFAKNCSDTEIEKATGIGKELIKQLRKKTKSLP